MKKEIHILHISIADSKGGAAIAAYRLNQLMNNDTQFVSNMLVLMKNTDCDTVFKFNYLRKQYSRICNLMNNILLKFKKSFGSFSLVLCGNNVVSHKLVKEADILYIHWINSGMLRWNAIKKIANIGKPVFLFCHDMWYFTGGCHQSNGCIQYLTGCKLCPFFDKKMMQRCISKQYNKKKKCYFGMNVHLILPSLDFCNQAIHSKIIDKSRIHFIPNILDTNKYIPKQIETSKKRIKILYGALGGKSNPYKGWNDFLYMAKHINEKHDKIVEFALFGYEFQPDELKEIPFDFINHGIIYDEETLIEIYQNADVFIFSSHQESFGQTLVESMSCGVIPIAYNVGIADYLVENDINGYIVNIGNKDGLISAFEKLIISDIRLLKTKVRESILNKLSSNLVLDKHRSLILSSL